jgi:cold shock CspA family protein
VSHAVSSEGVLTASFNERGFTFIEPDEASGAEGDVFLHITAVAEGEDSRLFVRGRRVEYESTIVTRGTTQKAQARNARVLPGGGASDPDATVTLRGHHGTPKFWSPGGYGFIRDAAGEEFYVQAASVPGGYLRVGDQLEFDVEEHRDERVEAVNIRLSDWAATGDTYCDMLDMGPPRWAPQLAQLAEREHWNYVEKPARDSHVILRSYIKYTFLRVSELSDHVRVSSDGQFLSFNTGLVTPFQEEIFALFRRRQPEDKGPPWVLKGFEKASSVPFLRRFGGGLPALAWYFDDPSQLVFDTALRLSVNVEHVPHDPDRFPDALANIAPHDLAALVNAKAPEAVDRVRRNYKTAIPQFYRDGKSGDAKMQLLLPVALLRRDNVELALAVDRPAADVYLGRTVLTLDWAYNNARLLTRPDTDWLRP